MIQILYATQTGNSEYYAEELGRILPNSIVQEIHESSYIDLPEQQIVIFVISTTGDGDIPNNMTKFWQFLLIKDLPTNSLQKVKFTVFGLGDSSYPKFNYAGRKLRSRLLQLSAKEFVPSAFGDEQHPCGSDTEFVSWIEAVTSVCGKRTTIDSLYINVTETTQMMNQSKEQIIFKDKKLLTAPGHTKESYQFIFQSQDKYDCGDVLSIKPKNSSLLVEKFLKMMNLNCDQVIKLEQNVNMKNSKASKLPKIILLQTLFTEFLDLTSPPNRYFIQIMSQFAELDIHKQKLQEMSSKTPESLEEYYSYVYREKRNVVEVLYDFQPCVIPLPYLIDSLKLIRERQYSISSAYNGSTISITVALVSYTTGKNRNIKGFCTNYLNNLNINDQVQGSIQKGTVSFPNDITVPIIMIGPGTGVAPFIGFIEKRLQSADKRNTVLFFGSCYKDKEFYYEQLLTTAPITLFTAFSRDQKQKVYVQHKILENKVFLKELVANSIDKILIIVTGTSRKMPSQVEQAFKECLGEQTIELLKRRKQYLVECW